MRYSVILFLIFIFSLPSFAQSPRNPKVKKSKPAATQTLDEKAELEKAIAEPDASARIAALQKFIENFPQSKEIVNARERIVSARARLGEDSLKAGDTASGIEFFRSAVTDAPQRLSEKLFADVILQFPTNLFLRGQRDAAFEIAKLIEEKASGDAKQLLGLATFYITVENASNARRLAQQAIELAPEMPAAYQTLGIANRLGFRLDEAVTAYAKALELDPDSTVSKRSLAEMKRANGKTDEAITLYREILEKDLTDANAKTGLVLSLFEAGKQTEAESEMQKLLAENANNLPLLVGAAYFYAAKKDGAKAVDLAQKALAIEPRYTWANIALARGFLAQKRPLDAERVLLAARNYGNFPTIDYEIASARLQAGFYREAAEELTRNFEVKDGMLTTYLGNRVGVDAEDFLKLLSLERRAAIFSFDAADTIENAERLKSLLEFSKEVNNENANENLLSATADKFINGDDKMKIHRQLFVAGRLLDKKKNLPKVIELTQAAVKGVDTALDVTNPAAAVMADELYETRTLAISRGEVLLVPDVPRQTLFVILRGRIEELSGWTLYQQDKTAEAIVKLKRAVSVLPEDSNWWRSGVWRLGAAFEAAGQADEALKNYIKSYKSGEANPAKYIIIDSLYQKVNGNRDGLEEKIGKRPDGISDTVAKITENINTEPEISPTPEVVTEVSTQTEPVATPTPEITPEPEPVPTPEEIVETIPEDLTTPTPEPEISTSPTPEENQIVETTDNETENPTETVTEPITENPPTDETPLPTETETTPTPTPETTPEVENPVVPTPSPTPSKNTETVAKAETTSNSLFEPIVINVRKKENSKPKVSESETKTEQFSLTPKPVENEKSEPKNNETVVTKPRVFIEDNLKIQPPKCELVASQESVWLVNGGGSLGILVGFAGQGDAKQITAVSSSSKDIEISIEPEIGVNSGRAFFILKSISTKKGAFTVTFNSPCGKKEVLVRVR
ncbi:MAG: tetratricopeptide repeat protein [Pyrinomonadaceae bacterium]